MRVDFLKNIKRSFEISIKNKWLILLSVFVVSVTLSSPALFNAGNNTSKDSNPLNSMSLLQNSSLNQSPLNINPETTKAAGNFASSIAGDSVLGLTLLITLLISLIVISVIIKIYATNFAIGNLYFGIKEIDEDREVKLESMGIISRVKVWNLFITSLISSLIFLAILFPFFIAIIVGSLQTNLTFLMFFGGFFAAIFVFLFSLTDIYLTYIVLFTNKKGFEAFSLSIKYTFKYFLESIVFKVSQCLIGCLTCTAVLTITGIVGGLISIILTVFIGIIIAGGVTGILISAPFIIISLLVGGTLLTLIGAVVNLFYSSYTYLFNKDILKEEQ